MCRKGSRNRAAGNEQSLIDRVDSLKCGTCDSPQDAGDCGSTSSSERTDSDSEVSVDDVDDADERGSGCAAVPDGPTAASRLRLIVASEEKRRSQPVDQARRQYFSNPKQHSGQPSLFRQFTEWEGHGI